jgi:hypothetical protein
LTDFLIELLTPGTRDRVHLGVAPGFALVSLRADAALLFQPVQRRVQGALLDLEHIAWVAWIRLAMAHPCRGSVATAFRTRRSSVP